MDIELLTAHFVFLIATEGPISPSRDRMKAAPELDEPYDGDLHGPKNPLLPETLGLMTEQQGMRFATSQLHSVAYTTTNSMRARYFRNVPDHRL